MKNLKFYLSLSFMIILLNSCGPSESSCKQEIKNVEVNYVNLYCVIVEKIPVMQFYDRTSKGFLIKSLQDSTMYSEYTTINKGRMETQYYYKYNEGDTLYFQYIRKERFFKIKNNKY